MAPITAGITEEILPAAGSNHPFDNAADFIHYLRGLGYEDVSVVNLPNYSYLEVVQGIKYAIVALIAVDGDKFLLGISDPKPVNPVTAEHTLKLFRRATEGDERMFHKST